MESTNEILEEIKKNLIAEFAPEKIYLFGSHVWGTPDQDSDLDLLVIVSQSKLPPTKRASLAYRCLRNIAYPLDIIVKTRAEVDRFADIPAALEHQVLERGRVIYG